MLVTLTRFLVSRLPTSILWQICNILMEPGQVKITIQVNYYLLELLSLPVQVMTCNDITL